MTTAAAADWRRREDDHEDEEGGEREAGGGEGAKCQRLLYSLRVLSCITTSTRAVHGGWLPLSARLSLGLRVDGKKVTQYSLQPSTHSNML